MVNPPGEFPISCRIIALIQERNRLFSYPLDLLADRIQETRFCCTLCGACCTRSKNGHVFLLDRDVATARTIDPASLVPAPDPEFCDQNGTCYVSGYAVRTRGDTAGSCWFLEESRCRIYPQRFSVCRTYPYMIRRTVDDRGEEDWCLLARSCEHGSSGRQISSEDSRSIALETRAFENALLTHEIAFLESIKDHFSDEGLFHDPVQFTRSLHRIAAGEPVPMMVYHDHGLERHVVGPGWDGRLRSRLTC